VLSAFLDRADGELARLSGQTSVAGHRYDLYSDAIVNVLLFIGIGIGLSNSILGLWAPFLGIISGASVGGIFWIVAIMESRADMMGALPFSAVNGFDPDDVLFIVGPLSWIDDLISFLIASSFGAPLFLVFAMYCVMRMHH